MEKSNKKGNVVSGIQVKVIYTNGKGLKDAYKLLAKKTKGLMHNCEQRSI